MKARTASGAPIAVHYETSADKAIGFQIDNTFGEDGQPASTFLDFTSASDSEVAGRARRDDNDRLQQQTESLVAFAGQLVGLGAAVAGAPGVGGGGGSAPAAGGTDLEQLLEVIAAVRGQPAPAAPPAGGGDQMGVAKLLALLQALQPPPAAAAPPVAPPPTEDAQRAPPEAPTPATGESEGT